MRATCTKFWIYFASSTTRKSQGLLDNSLTNQFSVSQVADCLTRGLDDLQTSKLAKNKFLNIAFRATIYFKFSIKNFGELTSPRIVQSMSCLICELTSPLLNWPHTDLLVNCPVTNSAVISQYCSKSLIHVAESHVHLHSYSNRVNREHS